jgi:hypothetical protein
VIGGGHLTWDELSEVLLDVEIQINRRPLTYVEDDVELPILTPVMFLHQRESKLPEEEPWRVEERELTLSRQDPINAIHCCNMTFQINIFGSVHAM